MYHLFDRKATSSQLDQLQELLARNFGRWVHRQLKHFKQMQIIYSENLKEIEGQPVYTYCSQTPRS